MQKVFQVYTDPQHGWIKVPRKLLTKLGIADKISSCSYMRGNYVYLEEDSDADKFFKAYKEHTGHEPEQRLHWTNRSSKIRNYFSYSPTGYASW